MTPAPWRYTLADYDLVLRCHPGRDAALAQTYERCLRALCKQDDAAPIRWLDLGAGDGSLNRRLFDASTKVLTGTSHALQAMLIENDVETLAKLTRTLRGVANKSPRRGWTAETLLADAFALPTELLHPGRGFDLVTAFHVLYYARQDWRGVVQRLLGIPSSPLICIALKSGDTPFYEALKQTYAAEGHERPYPFFAEDLLDVLKELQIPHIRFIRESEIHLPTEDRELRRLIAFTWRMPPSGADALVSSGLEHVGRLRAKSSGVTTFRDVHVMMGDVPTSLSTKDRGLNERS